MIYFIPFAMAVLARLSGWGAAQAGYKRIAKFPAEGAFAVAMGVVCSRIHGGDVILLYLGAIWTIFMFNLGHGNFFHDGVFPIGSLNTYNNQPNVDDPEFIEKWTGLHWLLPKLGLTPRTTWYCRIMMAVKGLLVGLAIFPYGLPLIVLWPLAYAIGFRINATTLYAEWASGFFAGLCVLWAVLS